MSALLSWLDDPEPGRGLHIAEPGGGWSHHPYTRLAAVTRRIAAGLTGLDGDVVAVMLRPGPHLAAAVFGVLVAGASPALLAPPPLFGDAGAHAGHLARCVLAARAQAILTEPDLLGFVGARRGGPRVYDVATLAAGTALADVPRRGPDELALIQFTSGSTGAARGVRVPFGALERSVDSIRDWLGMDGTAATATWLPAHHDMGLVGCLLTPVVDRSDLWLLRPEDFVRNPLRYLECFRHARLSAMPGFGLDHVVRRVRPDALVGLDLSGWRALVLGAERLVPSVLDRFVELLAPAGFDASALLPAYGMAEATLAVTGVRSAETWAGPAFDRDALRAGHARPARASAPALRVVGCGRPMPGVEVRVAGTDGQPLPAGGVGEIIVGGATLAAGYTSAEGDRSASQTAFDGGELRTGDAGFLHNGELYVLGRLGDSTKVRGRPVFAEDLECALADTGIPRQRCAIVLGQDDDRPTMLALLEHPEPHWLTAAEAVLRSYADSSRVLVARVPRGAISRTTSGKSRRRELWSAYLSGRLPTTELLR